VKLNSSQTSHVFWMRCYSIISITQNWVTYWKLMYFVILELQVHPSAVNSKGWWDSKPAYISLLISQVILMGRVLIFSLSTSSNLSLCATVIIFFQSPTVPEERSNKAGWEAEHAPVWKPAGRQQALSSGGSSWLPQHLSVASPLRETPCALWRGHFQI